ncbi:MAG TPA: hypothetical protein PLJ21_07560 [Pseudobdellovibrionaceae bacterium]|nr:hypothetical protein [Pseudobdellovibrionaceae bacterium]
MGKLEIKMVQEGPILKVKLNGEIDEDIDFSQSNINSSSQISFDLEGVKSINSCGIREWIKWLSTAKSAQIVFLKCPKIIVDQINMVDSFLPSNAQVDSFYVPYFNEDSGEEKSILFTRNVEFSKENLKTPVVKDSKGNDMEMDILESKYFKFLKK